MLLMARSSGAPLSSVCQVQRASCSARQWSDKTVENNALTWRARSTHLVDNASSGRELQDYCGYRNLNARNGQSSYNPQG